MSLFQCENCGCVENTALAFQGVKPMPGDDFDFTGIEDRKNKMLCSECAPKFFNDGTLTGLGEWHGKFDKTLLPLGLFKTNVDGNIEHTKTGETDYKKYEVKENKLLLCISEIDSLVEELDDAWDKDDYYKLNEDKVVSVIGKFKELCCDMTSHEFGLDQCGYWQHSFCYKCSKALYPNLIVKSCVELSDEMGTMTEEYYLNNKKT